MSKYPSQLRLLLLLIGTWLATVAPIPIVQGFAILLTFSIWPGVGVAHWIGRPARWGDAVSLAIVLGSSMALAPLIVFTLSLVAPTTGAVVTAELVLATALLIVTAPQDARAEFRAPLTRKALALLLLPAVLSFATLIPVQTDVRSSILPGFGQFRLDDWYKHYGIAWEIRDSGIPPKNLMLFTAPPITHVYHIFFHIPPAMLDLASGRQFSLGLWLTVWAALAVLAMLSALYAIAWRLWGRASPALAALAFATLCWGLDAVPTAFDLWQRWQGSVLPNIYFHLDGWTSCATEITTFQAAFAWVPQHVLSLGIVLLAWLLLLLMQDAAPSGRAARVRTVAVIAGLIVSASGHSIYVPLPVVIGVAVWVGYRAVRLWISGGMACMLRSLVPWVAFGLFSLIVALPLIRYELGAGAASSSAAAGLWVRHVENPAPLRGALFQWLLPQSGYLGQLLDVPLLLLIEIGAPLVLALLVLSRWRMRRLTGAEQFGAAVAISSLLIGVFVRSQLGCNDLGMRALFPLQAAIALLAGRGWAILTSGEGRTGLAGRWTQAASNVEAHTTTWRLPAGAALLTFVLVTFSFQRPYTSHIDFTAAVDDQLQAGVYQLEHSGNAPIRWTRERVRFVFDGFSPFQTYRLTIRAAAGSRPAAADAPRLSVLLNGLSVGQFLLDAAHQSFTLDLPPDKLMPHSGAELVLQIPTFRPSDYGEGDGRKLGMLLDSVTFQQAADGPFTLPALDILAGCMLIAALLTDIASRRSVAIVASVGLPAGIALARSPVAQSLLPLSIVALIAWSAWSLVSPRRLRRLIALLTAVGVATNIWIFIAAGASRYLPAFDLAAFEDDQLSMDLDAALRWIRTEAPPNAVLVVEQDETSLARAASVAAERAHYYTEDYVFVYQIPKSEERARNRQVKRSMAAMTTTEACDGFRAMGVNYVLVDMRHYKWATPEQASECFAVRFRGKAYTVLEPR